MESLLIIGSNFFNYGERINSAAAKIGYRSVFLQDIAEQNFIYKAIVRKIPSIRFILSFFFRSKITKVIDKVNPKKILIIKGEGITKHTLNFIKNKYPAVEILSYYWDSLDNMPHDSIEKAFIVHRAYTFDKNDSNTHKILNYLPLFFTERSSNDYREDIDVLFIGTMHDDRYEIVTHFEKKHGHSLKIFKYFYLENKFLYFFRKFFLGMYKNSNIKEFKFEPVPYAKFSKLIKNSKAVLDINRPNQSGLTIRSIEVLGLKKKLITTNASITSEDFYTAKNIAVIDRTKCDIELSFFREKFENNTYINNLYITNWLKQIFQIL